MGRWVPIRFLGSENHSSVLKMTSLNETHFFDWVRHVPFCEEASFLTDTQCKSVHTGLWHRWRVPMIGMQIWGGFHLGLIFLHCAACFGQKTDYSDDADGGGGRSKWNFGAELVHQLAVPSPRVTHKWSAHGQFYQRWPTLQVIFLHPPIIDNLRSNMDGYPIKSLVTFVKVHLTKS